MAIETLTEAEKMRRVPGIVFADGPTGRRARIAGTGIDGFEVIGPYREMGESWESLREAFHWLSEPQLRAALAYFEAFPEEITGRLSRQAAISPEYIASKYPLKRI